LRGGIFADARKVKQTLLQVDASKIVSEHAALTVARQGPHPRHICRYTGDRHRFRRGERL
jgi:hypothetical protein